MTSSKVIMIALLLASASSVYYFFIDTLRLSDLIESSTESGFETLLIDILDFDTGLTRYDVHRLRPKSQEWLRRIKANAAITDFEARQEADLRLSDEMLRDPIVRKLSQKMLGLGAKSIKTLLPALAGT